VAILSSFKEMCRYHLESEAHLTRQVELLEPVISVRKQQPLLIKFPKGNL